MATKRVPRARVSVSSLELDMVFRGETVFWPAWGPRSTKKSRTSPKQDKPDDRHTTTVDTQKETIGKTKPHKHKLLWPRKGSPGHGVECRPLNWPSFFAENPFPATSGPGEAQKITNIETVRREL